MAATVTSPNLAGRRRFPARRRAAACPPREVTTVERAYDEHAQRGLEHDEAMAATAVQLRVSVHAVQRALAARGPVPTLAALAPPG
jgi:hypothetical protein